MSVFWAPPSSCHLKIGVLYIFGMLLRCSFQRYLTRLPLVKFIFSVPILAAILNPGFSTGSRGWDFQYNVQDDFLKLCSKIQLVINFFALKTKILVLIVISKHSANIRRTSLIYGTKLLRTLNERSLHNCFQTLNEHSANRFMLSRCYY